MATKFISGRSSYPNPMRVVHSGLLWWLVLDRLVAPVWLMAVAATLFALMVLALVIAIKDADFYKPKFNASDWDKVA